MSRRMTVDTAAHQQIVEILTKARHKAGLQQIALAKQLGVSQTWVARVETGKRRLDIMEFARLAHALKLDPVKVLGKIMRRVK